MNGIRRCGCRLILVILTLIVMSGMPSLAGLNRHEILLVVNAQSPVSVAIADYYQAVRGIPATNVCVLTECPPGEYIDPAGWYDYIRTPIWNYLTDSSHPWLQDQIKAIVLTKGIPVRFWADGGREASVDSPLCYLGNNSFSGTEPTGSFAPNGNLTNRYCGRDEAFEVFRGSTSNQCSTSFPSLRDI